MPRTPDYRRVVDGLKAQIDSGELRPGDRLPSISQLRDVSAQPVKAALTILHELGRTEGHQGRGVFVVQ